jgi:hypothetical protein
MPFPSRSARADSPRHHAAEQSVSHDQRVKQNRSKMGDECEKEGLQFTLPDGEEWRTAMIDLPVFPFNTPQAFFDNLAASEPDPQTTHKPDPQKMTAFVACHPEFLAAIKIIKSHEPPSARTTEPGEDLLKNKTWFVESHSGHPVGLRDCATAGAL